MLKDDDKESVASETHNMPETQGLDDVSSSLIENKREVLSEGDGDYEEDKNQGNDHDDDDEDRMLNMLADECTCGADSR